MIYLGVGPHLTNNTNNRTQHQVSMDQQVIPGVNLLSPEGNSQTGTRIIEDVRRLPCLTIWLSLRNSSVGRDHFRIQDIIFYIWKYSCNTQDLVQ